jgi:hypothetical protein
MTISEIISDIKTRPGTVRAMFTIADHGGWIYLPANKFVSSADHDKIRTYFELEDGA